MALRKARRIRIHCPVSAAAHAGIVAGDLAASGGDPALAAILAIIRAPGPLGDFGLYKGVFELGAGVEGFTPTAAATPTAGTAGHETLSHSVTVTTWADAEADIDAALAHIVAAHPWEIPVIEIAEVTLRS